MAHSTVLSNGFVWDDLVFLQKWSQAHANLVDVFTVPPEPGYYYYRPMLFLSALLDRVLWGDIAFGFHLTNLVLHAVCAALVGAIGWDLARSAPIARSAAAWVGGSAGLLFAIAPWNLEPVTWVFARGTVISTFFILLGSWTWLAYLRRPRATRGLPWWPALLLLLALLTKETAVLLVPIYWLLAITRAHEPLRVRQPVILFVFAFLIYGLLRTYASSPASLGTTDALSLASESWKLINLVRAAGFYGTAFVRAQQTPFIEVLHPAYALFGVGFLLAGAVALYATWRHEARVAAMGLAWFAGCMVVPLVIAVVPPSVTIVAYRHLYLPTVGVALTVGIVLGPLIASRPWAKLGALVLIAAATVTNVLNNRTIWTSDRAYWEYAVIHQDQSHIAHANLAAALSEDGEFDAALAHYIEALRRDTTPVYEYSTGKRAVEMLLRYGRVDAAARLLAAEMVTRNDSDPYFGNWLLLYANVQYMRLDDEPTRRDLRRVLDLYRAAVVAQPNLLEGTIAIGRVYERMNEPALALHAYVTALHRLDEHSSIRAELEGRAHRLNQMLLHVEEPALQHHYAAQRAMIGGDLRKAAEEFEQAAAIDPSRVWSWRGLANMRRELGDTPGSMAALDSGIAAAHTEYERNALRMDEARLHLHAGEDEKARELARAVLEEYEDPSACWLLAVNHLEAKEFEDSEAYLQRFIASWQGDPRMASRAVRTLERVREQIHTTETP